MKLYIKALLITLVVATALGFLFWKWRASTAVEAPERIAQIDQMETDGVPDFELKSLEGKKVRLSDFKGKIVILSFWASWCGPCVEEFPSMIQLVEKMEGQVQLVAVSEDSSREEIEAFLNAFPKSKNPHIHILWDEDHSLGQKFNADRLPESFVLTADQKLARKIVGSINWASEDAQAYMRQLLSKSK